MKRPERHLLGSVEQLLSSEISNTEFNTNTQISHVAPIKVIFPSEQRRSLNIWAEIMASALLLFYFFEKLWLWNITPICMFLWKPQEACVTNNKKLLSITILT